MSSREKHKRQEETINKILRFLAGVFGGQVLDSGGSGGGGGVEATSPSVGAANSASPPESSSGVMGGGGGSGSGSGKGKATAHDAHANNGVAVIPRRARSRLLLEDVKGRQAERAEALRELDGSEEEEIEEIPLLHEEDDGLPTISSCASAFLYLSEGNATLTLVLQLSSPRTPRQLPPPSPALP